MDVVGQRSALGTGDVVLEVLEIRLANDCRMDIGIVEKPPKIRLDPGQVTDHLRGQSFLRPFPPVCFPSGRGCS